ncbi:MAG: hypothetical protein M3N10_11575 [Actinomycetota bacterium]|nr:hypothetical protein [Actinomycetota bacterium]
MTSSALVRIGGLAAIAAGALLLVADVWSLLGGEPERFSDLAVTTTWTAVSAMYLIGVLLLLAALVGLYARQSDAAGALGVAGFLAALVGTGLLAGMMWTLAFVVPSAAIEAPAFLNAEQTAGPLDAGFMLSGLAVAIGWALFGVATLRAGVFPRIAAIILIVGAILTFLPLPATTVVIDVAVAWLGFLMLTGRSQSLGRAATVR